MRNMIRFGLFALIGLFGAGSQAQAWNWAWNGSYIQASLDHGGFHFRTTSQHLASLMLLGPGRYTLAYPGYAGGYGFGSGPGYAGYPTTYHNGTFLGPYCNGQVVHAAPPCTGWATALAGVYGANPYAYAGGYGAAPMPAGPIYPGVTPPATPAVPTSLHQTGYSPSYYGGAQPGYVPSYYNGMQGGYAPWGYYPVGGSSFSFGQ